MTDSSVATPTVALQRWTLDQIEAKLRDARSVGITATDVAENQAAVWRTAALDLLAERDALLAERQPASTFRLPDWLGGHEVHIDRELEHGKVSVWVRDHESTLLTIGRDRLVEVRPPSIGDPVALPLRLDALASDTEQLTSVEVEQSDHADYCAYLRIIGVGGAWIGAREAGDAARALWKLRLRANAVERGA